MERYDIHELIGEGSFGSVYRAIHKETKDIVAVKLIQKTGRTEKELKYLRQECDIQKKLKHANIIHLLDSFETPEHVVVVTEFANGELFRLLKKEGNLSVQRVQSIAYDLVSALYYLHSNRILHRDIKPQNILIGFDGLAKLCDFGFARTMGIDTYMLTSIKGTPLYMAPEIVEEKPYDHNADLWSLGCILYELIVGTPPFCTTSLIQLVTKIRSEPIYWPDKIQGDCKSFLQGLLEKDPKKRLTWPKLLQHPFVGECLLDNQPEQQFSLTKALSPSQEFAKENQRQHLQRKLAGYSKLLIKTAKKLEEAQKELKRCSRDSDTKRAFIAKNSLSSPSSHNNNNNNNINKQRRSCVSKPPKVSPPSRSSHSPVNHNNHKGAENENDNNESDNSMSSCETMTSTSSSISDVSDDDGRTVILDHQNCTGTRRIVSPELQNCAGHSSTGHGQHNHVQQLQTIQSGIENLRFPDPEEGQDGEQGGSANSTHQKHNGQRGSDLLWKSGALFTLHSFGSEDKPIESEEWIDFVGKTMKEVQENPESLCEKHFLTVLVAPLRNHLAGAIVIEKIATLLAMPFILTHCKANLQRNLELIYLDAKVLPNLLYSCKLMMRRRRIERNSLNLNSNDRSNDMVNILEEEDLDGMDKSMRLMTYLVHIHKDFVLQFCDSVCVLQAFPIFLLFLRLDKKRPRLTVDMLSILCHLLRAVTSANNDGVIIVEELLLDHENCEGDNSELIRLLSDSNGAIQSKTIRLLGYLIIYSEKAREQLVRPKAQLLWTILNEALTCADSSVVSAAEFSAAKLRQFIPYNSQRSSDDDIAVSQ